jgi:hypothetical protein
MNDQDIFRGCGVQIELVDEDGFLKVKETLTRIGVASRREKKLYQSCHILHKQGRYAILHFKELFLLDGKINNFSQEDRGRRNTIVNLLEEWNLIRTIDTEKVEESVAPLSQIKVLPYREKSEWELVTKYSIGKKR